MTSASLAATTWRIHHLTDLCWDISHAAETLVAEGLTVGDDHLVDFWVGSRGLTTHWLRGLAEWTAAAQIAADREQFEIMAAEILAGDVLVRLWSTALSVQDRQAGQNNARAILDLVVFNLQHVRHKLLTALLDDAFEFAEVDRFRRRCERWTDALLGPLVVRYGHAHYAYDGRRAWDFGEDAACSETSDVAQRMLWSSYRIAFDGPLASGRLTSEVWNGVIASIDRYATSILGPSWPSKWRQPPSGSAPTLAADFTLSPGDQMDESAFIRSLRRIDERRLRGE